METWQLILLSAIGVIAGILNVIAGGGSLLTLPAMILMGLPASVANGTNRVAILAQNITAVTAFRSRGFSDFRLSLTLALASVPGAVAGAWMGTIVRGEVFNRILAGIMLGVIVLMALKHRRSKPAENVPARQPETSISTKRVIAGHVAMIFVGLYGGFIQAGVGFLLMAALQQLMGLDLVRVNMHKVFIVGAFTLAALIVFVIAGKVLWIPGLALAVGNSLGGWVGSHLSISKGENFIRRVLYLTLIAMAVKLLWG